MIQDIEPRAFDNRYRMDKANKRAYLIYACGDQVLLKEKQGRIFVPAMDELGGTDFQVIYLFSVDEQSFFLPYFQDREAEKAAVKFWERESGYAMYRLNGSGTFAPKWLYFACGVAKQLNNWYRINRFCGCCGERMRIGEKERSVYCPCCGNTVYPKISPAIIAGVIHEDKLLMTKYADRRDGTRYALIAGYAEVGETIEDTLRREVMEETGLKVKNIRYYKSQPWPYSDTLLLGFFCELDGEERITLDHGELSEAEWISREAMEIQDDGISLTYEMMEYFKKQRG